MKDDIPIKEEPALTSEQEDKAINWIEAQPRWHLEAALKRGTTTFTLENGVFDIAMLIHDYLEFLDRSDLEKAQRQANLMNQNPNWGTFS